MQSKLQVCAPSELKLDEQTVVTQSCDINHLPFIVDEKKMKKYMNEWGEDELIRNYNDAGSLPEISVKRGKNSYCVAVLSTRPFFQVQDHSIKTKTLVQRLGVHRIGFFTIRPEPDLAG